MAVFIGYGLLAVGIAYESIRTMTPTRDIALGRMMVLELFCTLGLVTFLYRLWLQDIVHPLQYQAERDDLTGVWRAGAFWMRADRALKQLRHSTDPHDSLAFAFLDIDDFQAINDTYGHLIGDAVLRAMGRHLRQGLRSGDTIGRLGGEEFGCILRQVEEDTVRDLFLRILSACETTRIGPLPGWTFSGGIVRVTANTIEAATVWDIMHQADQQLYTAKQTGKRTIIVRPANMDCPTDRIIEEWSTPSPDNR